MIRQLGRVAILIATWCVMLVPASLGQASETGQPGRFTFERIEPSGSSIVAVNVATGNLLVGADDVLPTDANYKVGLRRFYNSRSAVQQGSSLGPGWQFEADPLVQLRDEGSSVTVSSDNYATMTFARQPDGTYTSTGATSGLLAREQDGSWVLDRAWAGDRLTFNAGGTLALRTSNATAELTPTYTSAAGQTRLGSFGRTDGRRANLSFRGDGRVIEVDDPASGHGYYTYNTYGADSRLTRFARADGVVTDYGYGSGRLTSVRQGTTDVETQYDSEGRVVAARVRDGLSDARDWTFVYRPGYTVVRRPGLGALTYYYGADYVVTRVVQGEPAGPVVASVADTWIEEPELDLELTVADPAVQSTKIEVRQVTFPEEVENPGEGDDPLSDTLVSEQTIAATQGTSSRRLSFTPPATDDETYLYVRVTGTDGAGNPVGSPSSSGIVEYSAPESFEDEGPELDSDPDTGEEQYFDDFESGGVNPYDFRSFEDSGSQAAAAAAGVPTCRRYKAPIYRRRTRESREILGYLRARRKSKRNSRGRTRLGRFMEWSLKINSGTVARYGLHTTIVTGVRVRINDYVIKQSYRVPRVEEGKPGYRFHSTVHRYQREGSNKWRYVNRGDKFSFRIEALTSGYVRAQKKVFIFKGSPNGDCEVY